MVIFEQNYDFVCWWCPCFSSVTNYIYAKTHTRKSHNHKTLALIWSGILYGYKNSCENPFSVLFINFIFCFLLSISCLAYQWFVLVIFIMHAKCFKLTCFLTPGNMTTKAKNSVANRTQTATMDTSYVTDVRFDTVYNVGPSLLWIRSYHPIFSFPCFCCCSAQSSLVHRYLGCFLCYVLSLVWINTEYLVPVAIKWNKIKKTRQSIFKFFLKKSK